ncbi:MAG: diacylglycerol kinase family protein [Bacteroidales bacterium]|jgi:diacylglycerol kinase
MDTGIRNHNDHHFKVKERLRSFRAAFRGLGLLLKHEHNFMIHLLVLAIVIIAGFLLKISAGEWIAVTLAAGLVLAGESFNAAVEYLSDRVSPDHDPEIGNVKDVAAAGVLISAFIAIITGVIIFLPRIISLFR